MRKELEKIQKIMSTIKPDKSPPKPDIKKKSSPKKTPSPSLKEQRLKRKNSIQGSDLRTTLMSKPQDTTANSSEASPPQLKRPRVEITELDKKTKILSQDSASDTQHQDDNNNTDNHARSPNQWLCYESDESPALSPLHFHQEI